MRPCLRRALLVGALLLTWPILASAQRGGVTLSPGWYTLEGRDFEGTDPALGIEGQLWYAVTPRFEAALGLVRTSHNLDGSSDNLTGLVVYAEPRWRFPIAGGDVAPYVGARVGVARQSIAAGGFDAHTMGFAFGGVVGARFRLGARVALDGGLSYTHLSFGEWEVGGTQIRDSDTKGDALGLHAGIAFLLGS